MKSDRFDARDSRAKIILIYAILIVMTFISVYPLLDVVKISLRPYNSLFSTSLKLIPDNATLENFRIVLFDRPFMTWLSNSLIVSLSTAILGVVISITGAYSFSRFRFWGRRTMLTSFLMTQIFPAPMLLLPTYILLRQFNLINNFLGLIIPYVATAIPLNIWVLKGYFDTIPISIEESAYVDGASFSQILTRIVIPLSLPAIGVGLLNSFMQAWNEYIIARIIMTDKNMNTLPVALVGMTGSFNSDWGIYSAASLITAIPVMVVFIGMSKFLINGLTLGGVKG